MPGMDDDTYAGKLGEGLLKGVQIALQAGCRQVKYHYIHILLLENGKNLGYCLECYHLVSRFFEFLSIEDSLIGVVFYKQKRRHFQSSSVSSVEPLGMKISSIRFHLFRKACGLISSGSTDKIGFTGKARRRQGEVTGATRGLMIRRPQPSQMKTRWLMTDVGGIWPHPAQAPFLR